MDPEGSTNSADVSYFPQREWFRRGLLVSG